MITSDCLKKVALYSISEVEEGDDQDQSSSSAFAEDKDDEVDRFETNGVKAKAILVDDQDMAKGS